MITRSTPADDVVIVIWYVKLPEGQLSVTLKVLRNFARISVAQVVPSYPAVQMHVPSAHAAPLEHDTSLQASFLQLLIKAMDASIRGKRNCFM
jgi:hypothetical protein